MFHPLGPNLFLSIKVEWKKHKANKMAFYLGSASSISSLEKKVQALVMLALKPEGGSLVNLIDLSKIPIGTPKEGSIKKKTKNKINMLIKKENQKLFYLS